MKKLAKIIIVSSVLSVMSFSSLWGVEYQDPELKDSQIVVIKTDPISSQNAILLYQINHGSTQTITSSRLCLPKNGYEVTDNHCASACKGDQYEELAFDGKKVAYIQKIIEVECRVVPSEATQGGSDYVTHVTSPQIYLYDLINKTEIKIDRKNEETIHHLKVSDNHVCWIDPKEKLHCAPIQEKTEPKKIEILHPVKDFDLYQEYLVEADEPEAGTIQLNYNADTFKNGTFFQLDTFAEGDEGLIKGIKTKGDGIYYFTALIDARMDSARIALYNLIDGSITDIYNDPLTEIDSLDFVVDTRQEGYTTLANPKVAYIYYKPTGDYGVALWENGRTSRIISNSKLKSNIGFDKNHILWLNESDTGSSFITLYNTANQTSRLIFD